MNAKLVEAKKKFLFLAAFFPTIGKLLTILAPILQAFS
jgi:membrane protein YqaA with SNARE-associated domain